MDFELPVGYPVTENTAISNLDIFSYIRDAQIGMHTHTDHSTLPVKHLFEEDIIKCFEKDADNSDFHVEALVFGIAPITTAKYALTPQPFDCIMIDNEPSDRTGSFEEIKVVDHNSSYNNKY